MIPNKWWHYVLLTILVGGLSVAALVAIAAAVIYPALPSLEALTDYRPKLPLRVYSEDGYLISEFGEERRAYIKIEDVPKKLKDAVIAIEDRRFYQHHGVDFKGVLRAAFTNLKGGNKEGASTITMQVARNFFLSSERNLKRKINEALLALKIERSLTKEKILELYINQIYLGQRAYGFAAASQVYYGKPLEKLNLAETALLAGLPKAPSGYNPFVNPKRAITRQKEVLHDMFRYGFIDEASYQSASAMPLRFKASKQSRDLSAEYAAEIVRESLYQKYQDDIYSSGLNVYTTLRKSNQEAANIAVRDSILEYDIRHAYRGPERTLDDSVMHATDQGKAIDDALDEIEVFSEMIPAVVIGITDKGTNKNTSKNTANNKELYIEARTKSGESIEISGAGLALVQKNMYQKDESKRLLKIGSVIRLLKNDSTKTNNGWQIVQLPQVEAAFVALDPDTGAVRALVGGFDFNRNKFNHVTQAWRQPGSSFKPFVYSAALEKGFTPASIVEDAPLTYTAGETGDGAWNPQNYDGTYSGPIRMRQALVKSKNMVSIRILESIGARYAQDYITRFGFDAKRHPAYLTMALGAGSVTPWQMAGAYAVFANGGYRVKPNLIAKIVDSNGRVVFKAKFEKAKNGAPRVIDARNAFVMTSMMQDVVRRGTATKALRLGRNDLAGKTGTTNNNVDAWFAGYNAKQVGVAWMGFDRPRSLGSNETGGGAALPIWIKYMATALRGVPEVANEVPDGVSLISIDPTTGIRSDDEDSINEYFYHENPPPQLEVPLLPMVEEASQVQKLLQPEIILSPRSPNQGFSTPNLSSQPPPAKPEQILPPPNAAAKMLNPN